MSKTPEAFIFDLDGTIYLGDQLIPGADKVLQQIRNIGSKVRFVTNNPRFSRETYAQKLNEMGVEADVEEVVTSSWLTASYLKKNPAYGKVFLVGENQLYTELRESGIPIVEEEFPDTVIISFDTTLTYEKLQHAYYCLINDANFIATNPDFVCPTQDGGLLDAGTLIAGLEAATGRKVEKVVGKPSHLLGELILDDLAIPSEECVVVGDRLNTDIRLGKQAGMKTVWIQPDNEDTPKNLEYVPDFTIKTVADLLKAMSI